MGSTLTKVSRQSCSPSHTTLMYTPLRSSSVSVYSTDCSVARGTNVTLRAYDAMMDESRLGNASVFASTCSRLSPVRAAPYRPKGDASHTSPPRSSKASSRKNPTRSRAKSSSTYIRTPSPGSASVALMVSCNGTPRQAGTSVLAGTMEPRSSTELASMGVGETRRGWWERTRTLTHSGADTHPPDSATKHSTTAVPDCSCVSSASLSSWMQRCCSPPVDAWQPHRHGSSSVHSRSNPVAARTEIGSVSASTVTLYRHGSLW
mmetsp:Transcript_35198/g.70372  ORF Transcript_35198/g.70372 Transcript_35198/m.70372 type:complete len:262 (-) Transcript_35198:414-1199(-)